MFDQPDKVKEAIGLFEDVASEYVSNNLMRFHAKALYFKCVLLFLVLEDSVGAEKALEKYIDNDPNLGNSYEKKFLKNIIGILEEGSLEKYGDECYKLNSRMTIDKQLTLILTEIKKQLKKEEVIDEDFDPL